MATVENLKQYQLDIPVFQEDGTPFKDDAGKKAVSRYHTLGMAGENKVDGLPQPTLEVNGKQLEAMRKIPAFKNYESAGEIRVY